MNRFLFLIGWLLSPFTTWNDAFINIPLAYISASLFFRIIPLNFTILVVVFYWLTNVAGVLLMYLSGRDILKEKSLTIRSVLITLLLYTAVLLMLDWALRLRPLQ